MPRRYKIQSLDTLPAIAQRFYGDARKWPVIERASSFRSGRGQLIYEGEIAVIPDLPGSVTGDYPLSEDVDENEITLVVNGQTFRGWQGVTIEQNEDSVADGFALDAPFDPAIKSLREGFRPFGYQFAQLYIGRDLLLRGTIEQISPSIAASGRLISVGGRSVTGAMVECSVEGSGAEFAGHKLRTICEWVAGLFGVEVQDDTEDTGDIAETRPEPGQSAFDFLNSLAKGKGRLLTSDSRGVLTISMPSDQAEPVASLVEGEWPLLGVAAEYDGTKRFSRYIVYLDQDGTPGVRGVAEDDGVKIYRPTRVDNPNTSATDASRAAAWERTLSLVSATSVNVTAAGWRNADGAVWRKGEPVTLLAPSAMIYREATFRIAGVTMRIDEDQGRITELRLVLPEAYTASMPGAYPWD
ncbi:MAG: phage baseplate assembly protein [Spirochaetota bacterium]